MNPLFPDLASFLSDARRTARDDRQIWCKPALGFATTKLNLRGLLLGGAASPQFLREPTDGLGGVPWMMQLLYCRVIVCDQAAHEPLAKWLPLMEAIAQSGESLLIVADRVETELLSTLIVNSVKGTLRVCVVNPPRDRNGIAVPIDALGRPWGSPPKEADRLQRVAEVWVRRTATAVFPDATEATAYGSALQDLVVIEAGGESHEDQTDRLRFLMKELQQTR